MTTTPQTCSLPPFLASVVPSRATPEQAASAMQLFIQQLENYLRRLKDAVCTDLQAGGGGGATRFTQLTDVPNSYAGAADKAVRVNAAETGLEFFTLALVTAFIQLSDVPHSYAGAALQALRVNAGQTAVEFFTQLLTLMGDFPNSYAGAAGKVLAVNAGETAVEFSDQTVSDLSYVIQPRVIGMWFPNLTSTTAGQSGFATGSNGSSGQVQISSNRLLRSHHVDWSCAATANSAGGVTSLVAVVVRGDAANAGGFRIRLRIGNNTTLATQRAIVGASTSFVVSTDPVNRTDCAFFGYDSGDTVWSFFVNDSSGTCTKTSLGANFPIDTTSLYEFLIECLPNASSISWSVKNLTTGNSTSGTASSNLPTSSTGMLVGFMVGNGGTGSPGAATISHVCSVFEAGAT